MLTYNILTLLYPYKILVVIPCVIYTSVTTSNKPFCIPMNVEPLRIYIKFLIDNFITRAIIVR